MTRQWRWGWGWIAVAGLVALTLAGTLGANEAVSRVAAPYLYSSITDVPENDVALVLGTSKSASSGGPNLFFEARMDAAAALYKAGKVKYLLVSGDNGEEAYNEPSDMRDALVARGVPKGNVYLDYAGFRTLDSVLRAREVFGQTRFTVVSQAFHNERAVFIARHYRIEAVGFNAADVGGSAGARVNAREVLARVQVALDLYLLNTQPRFYGPRVPIP
jgi:SanA protein